MRKFTLIIILLFLGSVCQATNNYYVATNGNDYYTATQAQNPATPWHTIQKALDTVASNNYIINLAAGTYDYETSHYVALNAARGNGKTIVFLGADRDTTIFSSSTANAFIIADLTTGNITWKNMTIKSTYKGNRQIIYMGADYNGAQLTFNNCILGVNGDTTTGSTKCIFFYRVTASPPTRKVTLIDSYCYGKDNITTLHFQDIGALTISNSLVDRTNAVASSAAAIAVEYDIGTVTINNGSIIKSKSYGLLSPVATISSFTKCEVDNVTFDCNDYQAIEITDYLAQGIFTNITANKGISLGHVYEDCSHPLGSIVIQDCNLIHTGAVNVGVFGLVIGYGVTGAEVSNNNVLDFGIALSLKGTTANIHHNIFRGGSNLSGDFYTVYVRSAKNCLFNHNTVYGLGKYTLYLYDQVGGFPPDPNTDYNTFVNNIFDASGGGTYAIYLKGPAITHNLFDYNCYVAGSKALGYAGRAKKSLSELRTWWAANGGSEESRANESHSIDTAPQFMDAANGDFRLKPTSPCLNTGERTLDGGYTSIGAWQPNANVISGYVLELDGNTAVKGVLIQTDDNDVNTVTDANGFYELWVDYNWSGTATPTKTGYTFTPSSMPYTNVVSDQTNQDYTATPGAYTISGRITCDGDGLDGVTMNGLPGNPITSGGGYYSAEVSGCGGWTGTVTPTKTGYTFMPPSMPYTNVMSDQTNQDYTATPSTYTISGRVTFNGSRLDGVVMNGLPGNPVTHDGGLYSAEVSAWGGWSGIVTPSKTEYTFNPINRTYGGVAENHSDEDYIATLKIYTITAPAYSNGTVAPTEVVVNYGASQNFNAIPSLGYAVDRWYLDGNSVQTGQTTYTLSNITADHNVHVTFKGLIFAISGYVLDLDGNTAVEGVLIQTNSNDVNTVTDANGFYKLWVDHNWSGIVTPQKEGYVFEPDSNTYANVIQDYGDQNYIATLMTFKIAGYVLEQNYATPINDVNVSAENGGGPWTSRYGRGSRLTDANGYYEVVVDYNWSGKVTPTKYTYGFTPANIDYNNVIADQNNQNYNGKLLPFIISGYIKNGCDVPMAGVLVDANNGGGQGTTDVNGFYEVRVGYNWSGTVTPNKAHYTFDPNSNAYAYVLDDVIDQNYTATNIYDLDCDGSIGFGDLRIISENWLDDPDLPGDFYKDEDDIVNFLDFAEFAKHWLEGPIP